MPLRKGEQDRRLECVRRLNEDTRGVQREKVGGDNTVAPRLCGIENGFSIDQHGDHSFIFLKPNAYALMIFQHGPFVNYLFTSGHSFAVERTRKRLRNASAFAVAYWITRPVRSVVRIRVTKIGACSSTSR